MKEPKFDKDGYPTAATLDAISNWPLEDVGGLWQFIIKAWKYKDYFRIKGHLLHLSTGGWSGNEDIISAMMRNTLVWYMCWKSSRKGGHHVFKIK